MLDRAPPRVRVRELAVGEEPLGQPRPTFQRALQAVDLEQVEPDDVPTPP